MEDSFAVCHSISHHRLFGKTVRVKYDIGHSNWLALVIDNLAGYSDLGKRTHTATQKV